MAPSRPSEKGTDKASNASGAARARAFRPRTRQVHDLMASVRQHLEETGLEIIVLVEGIEARASNAFQARHSYTIDDLEFDKFFAPCMSVGELGNAVVNLNHFHQVLPAPSYCDEVVAASQT